MFAWHKACRKSLCGWALARHARSQLHVEAGAHLLGVTCGPTGGCVSGAPPASDFQGVLLHMETGESGSQADKRYRKIATSSNTSWMRWAVVEAMRVKDNHVLAHVGTVVSARDERANRLLIRYSACNATDAGNQESVKELFTVPLGVPVGFGTAILDEGL